MANVETDEDFNKYADRFTVCGCDILLDGKKFATAETEEAAQLTAGALGYSIGHYDPLIEYAGARRPRE